MVGPVTIANIFITPGGKNDYVDKMMVDARARHETVNKLFKDYNVFKNTYRGKLGFHHLIFNTCNHQPGADMDHE